MERLSLLTLLLICLWCPFRVSKAWAHIESCPKSCTCHEEHLIDLAVYRQTHRLAITANEHQPDEYVVTNDVIHEEEDDEIYNDENPLLKVAICLLQTESDPKTFISTMPKEIQAFTLIQGLESGNKTFYLSDFEHFDELIVLEIQGTQTNDVQTNKITFFIDSPIVTLKYINFDGIQVKNLIKLEDVTTDDNEVYIFEEKKDVDIQTVLMKKKPEEEILPYNVYKQKQKNLENPIFIGFPDLILLKISSCNLQNIYWEMFEGLQNLKYLILERNNLRFIPPFAFYGTPNLKTLSLAWNNLLNIQITDLAGLLELEYLDLSYNNFSQLSELSFPPFPKLKLADFSNNPITVVFPNTFDVMNTTDSIILGGNEIYMKLLPNSFSGLNKLTKLTVNSVDIPLLRQELLIGMPILRELVMTGKINEIEFDAFIELPNLQTLKLSNCNIYNISMDSFYDLDNLTTLDLSNNNLQFISPGTFDRLNLKELYLNNNKFNTLPVDIFRKLAVKLIRLNGNPWHCSCAMKNWDPMFVNKIKQKTYVTCNTHHDKGVSCVTQKTYKYLYENKVAPKCLTPNKFKGIGVFQALRKFLQCRNNEPQHKLNYTINKLIKTDKKIPVKIQKPIKNDFYSNKTVEPQPETVTKLKYNMKINEEPNHINIKLNPDINLNTPTRDNLNKELYKKQKMLQIQAKLRKIQTEQKLKAKQYKNEI